jgi:hypothetical protein
MAFITGSRAYGNPGPGSDLDLVVLMTPAAEDQLRRVLGCEKGAIRAGALNLVVTNDPDEYALWQVGTLQLQQEQRNRNQGRHPFEEQEGIPRDEAKEFLDQLFEAAGMPRDAVQRDSGPRP